MSTETKVLVGDKDFNEEIFTKIRDQLVSSQKEASEVRDLDGLKPFEVRKIADTLYMGIPSNIIALCKEYYLFDLLILANKINKVIGREVGEYQTTMPKNVDNETFLHGLGTPLVLGKLPDYKVKTRGKFGQGLSCAVKYILSSIKGADISLLKTAKVKSAPEEIFKDPWGKTYMTEKRLLDNVIMALKKVDYFDQEVKTWIFAWDKIKSKNGLNPKILDNALLDEVEKDWIKSDFKENLAVAHEVEPDIKGGQRDPYLLALTNAVRASIKAFKPVKDFVNDLTSLRIKCLYSHKDNQALKRKKKPMLDLKKNIMQTKEYVNAFNIGRGGQVRPPYILPYFPASQTEYNSVRTSIDEWYVHITGTDNRQRASVVQKWLVAAISE